VIVAQPGIFWKEIVHVKEEAAAADEMYFVARRRILSHED
jgi:hypothetical protein